MRKRSSDKTVKFQPLKKKRYSEQISELIQQKIIRESIAVGTLLPTELELAAEFQVSRTVIREALRILEVSGLVKIKKGPTGGIFVTDGYAKPIKNTLSNLVSSGEVHLHHLCDVRMLIEPQIAYEAALHASKKDIEDLRQLFIDSKAHMDDSNRLKKNNLNFHLLLAKASGNPVLSVLLESVIHILIEMSLEFRNLAHEQYFCKVHKNIFNAIEKGDENAARRLMEEDIMEIRSKLTDLNRSQKQAENNIENLSKPTDTEIRDA
jgi:DNA-binding FadR family transcriptional regulator